MPGLPPGPLADACFVRSPRASAVWSGVPDVGQASGAAMARSWPLSAVTLARSIPANYPNLNTSRCGRPPGLRAWSSLALLWRAGAVPCCSPRCEAGGPRPGWRAAVVPCAPAGSPNSFGGPAGRVPRPSIGAGGRPAAGFVRPCLRPPNNVRLPRTPAGALTAIIRTRVPGGRARPWRLSCGLGQRRGDQTRWRFPATEGRPTAVQRSAVGPWANRARTLPTHRPPTCSDHPRRRPQHLVGSRLPTVESVGHGTAPGAWPPRWPSP